MPSTIAGCRGNCKERARPHRSLVPARGLQVALSCRRKAGTYPRSRQRSLCALRAQVDNLSGLAIPVEKSPQCLMCRSRCLQVTKPKRLRELGVQGSNNPVSRGLPNRTRIGHDP